MAKATKPKMAMKEESECCKSNKGVAGVFIPGGLFLGFGVGFLIDNVPAGMFAGLGFGFIMFGIAMLCRK